MFSLIEAQPPAQTSAEWIKILLSALAGFISSALLELIKAERQRKQALNDMRAALYNELGQLYFWIYLFVKNRTTKDAVAAKITSATIGTYKWAKSQPNLFYKLKEAHALESLFEDVQTLKAQFSNPEAAQAAIERADMFVSVFRNSVWNNIGIDRALFQKELPTVFELILEDPDKLTIKEQGK